MNYEVFILASLIIDFPLTGLAVEIAFGVVY
jgi:hypothetical protein